MDTSVIYIAGTNFDGSVYSTFINNRHHLIKASLDWRSVMAKLKKVGRLPIQKLILAGKKAANQISIWKGI